MAVEVLVTAVLEVMVVVGASVDDVDISLVDEGTVELGPDVAEAVLPLSVVVELVVAVVLSVADSVAVDVSEVVDVSEAVDVSETVVPDAVVLEVVVSETVVPEAVVSEAVVVSEDVALLVVSEVVVSVEELSVVLTGGLVELVSVLLDSVGIGTALVEVGAPPEVVERCVGLVPMFSGELAVGAGTALIASQYPMICANAGVI